jgi:hypothetical protein
MTQPTRTICDIVDAVQEQQPVTEEELRLTLLCLFYDGQMSAPHDYETASDLKLRMRAKENFERRWRMLRAVPATYLGANWTPGSPENTAQREASKRILKAFEGSRSGGK